MGLHTVAQRYPVSEWPMGRIDLGGGALVDLYSSGAWVRYADSRQPLLGDPLQDSSAT